MFKAERYIDDVFGDPETAEGHCNGGWYTTNDEGVIKNKNEPLPWHPGAKWVDSTEKNVDSTEENVDEEKDENEEGEKKMSIFSQKEGAMITMDAWPSKEQAALLKKKPNEVEKSTDNADSHGNRYRCMNVWIMAMTLKIQWGEGVPVGPLVRLVELGRKIGTVLIRTAYR